jgi:hypothetical protein
LKLARDRREEARQQLAAGIDPGAKRKAEKDAQGDTFEAIARGWLAQQEPKLAPATFAKATWTLATLIFPGLGKRPIAKITAPDLLTVLRKIEVRGSYETAHRPSSAAARSFVTRSRPGVPSMTLLPICAGAGARRHHEPRRRHGAGSDRGDSRASRVRVPRVWSVGRQPWLNSPHWHGRGRLRE